MKLKSFLVYPGQISDGSPPRPAGPYLHGAFFTLLAALSPELADFAHSHLPRPFTLSNFFSRAGRPVFRITTLTDDLGNAVVEAFAEGVRFSLDSVEYTILSLAEEHNSSHEELYEQLFAAPEEDESRSLPVRFVSPTTFRHKQGNQPLPVPAKVWRSWQDSWDAFSVAKIGGSYQNWVDEYIFPSRMKISARVVQLGRAVLSGFTGDVDFVLTGQDIEQKRLARMLWAYSLFCGTGQKTAMGFGQTLPVSVLTE